MPILATPGQVVEPPITPAQVGMAAITWTGWDGSEWDLLNLNGNSGVIVGPGIRGLNMAPITRYTTISPATAGSTWRGSRTNEREVFWPLAVYCGDGSQAWVEYDRAFWRTMDPNRPGVWTVQQPDGTARSLTCRFVSDGNPSSTFDPSVFGWQAYGVTLVAEQPYWQGDPVVQTFGNATPTNFFGGPGGPGGPPFYISSDSTVSSATVSNPGDVEAYPVWQIANPVGSGSNITYAKVGVGSAVVEYTAAITPGSTITIDTRPDQLSVTDQAGVDRFGNLGIAQFNAPIPAGASVPLSLAMTGPGNVVVSFDTLYWRAW